MLIKYDEGLKTSRKFFRAAAMLNPNRDSRNLLSVSEKETGRTHIRALADKICVQIDIQNKIKQCSTCTKSTRLMTFMRNFPEAISEDNYLAKELYELEESIDCDEFAFVYFKTNKQFPCLREAARIILTTMPSPACAERAFSEVTFLTEDWENRLKTSSKKTR